MSAIFKQSADGTVQLGKEGLAGDEQADRIHHGGPDKAVCVYSHAHYPHWEKLLNRRLSFGAFGENFTVASWTETDVHIGDVFRVGTASVQISQPRIPCWKLAMKHGLDELPNLIAQRGTTGYYFRVMAPGIVKAGDEIARVDRHPAGVTVADANRIMHRDKNDMGAIRRLLELKGILAMDWIVSLEKRLTRLQAEG